MGIFGVCCMAFLDVSFSGQGTSTATGLFASAMFKSFAISHNQELAAVSKPRIFCTKWDM